MRFQLQFSITNSAFAPSRTSEIARILRTLAEQIEADGFREGLDSLPAHLASHSWPLWDANGCGIGNAKLRL